MAVSFELMLLRVLGHVGGLLHVDFGLLTPFRGSNDDFRKKMCHKKVILCIELRQMSHHMIVVVVVVVVYLSVIRI